MRVNADTNIGKTVAVKFTFGNEDTEFFNISAGNTEPVITWFANNPEAVRNAAYDLIRLSYDIEREQSRI